MQFLVKPSNARSAFQGSHFRTNFVPLQTNKKENCNEYRFGRICCVE